MEESLLLRLPDELIQSILEYSTPRETALASATCSRLYKIANEPLLWRYYCRTVFDIWQDRAISQQLIHSTPDLPWKQRFVNRIKRDGHNMHVFEALLKTQQTRYMRMQEIADSGYEAREMLHGFCQASPEAEDVLARRYWAQAILAMVHRAHALETWNNSTESYGSGLEKNMNAFDLFVIGSREGDYQDISDAVDDIANEIRREHLDLEELDLEQRALRIVRHLRARRLVGNPNLEAYHAVQNNYLSFALLDDEHTSLPLQSTVIFVSVARRLGIAAAACNFPTHIYAMVPLTQPEDPDAPWGSATAEGDFFYLDPWQQDRVIAIQDLHTQLQQFGIPSTAHAQYLAPALPQDMVLRTGRNLLRSWEEWRRGALGGHPSIDMDSVFYSFLWSILIIAVGDEHREENIHRRRSYLPYLLETFQQNFPEDVGLVEKYLSRLLEGHPQRNEFFHLTAELRAGDANAKPVTARTANMAKVRFKIGQLFAHRRLGYVGVVTGWDPKCQAGEQWIAQMSVDRLPQGREQSFYHILAEDKSKRYVAEENIGPLFEPPSEMMLKLAGRYFKRWDNDTSMFISNIQDEYPDD